MAKQSFLLTRFNVAKCDEDWLDIRLKLFEKFCVPSVLNQVYKDFTWLIFFDPRTPFRYVDRILNCGFKDVVPLVVDEKSNNFFVNSGNEVTKVAAEAVKKRVCSDDTVVTARLDSDDCLHRDFMENLRNCVVKVGNYYGFPLGYRYEPSSNIFYTYRVNGNSFISYYENAENVETVYNISHVDSEGKVIELRKGAMWLQLLHNNWGNYSILCQKCNSVDCGCEVSRRVKWLRTRICAPDPEIIKKDFGFEIACKYI